MQRTRVMEGLMDVYFGIKLCFHCSRHTMNRSRKSYLYTMHKTLQQIKC